MARAHSHKCAHDKFEKRHRCGRQVSTYEDSSWKALRKTSGCASLHERHRVSGAGSGCLDAGPAPQTRFQLQVLELVVINDHDLTDYDRK